MVEEDLRETRAGECHAVHFLLSDLGPSDALSDSPDAITSATLKLMFHKAELCCVPRLRCPGSV